MPHEAASLCALTDLEVFNESDAFTREIYGMGGAVLGEVTQDIARVIVDLNRPKEDLPPAKVDGAVKAITIYGSQVWRPDVMPDQDLVNVLLERYYDPYHRRLEALLDEHAKEVRILIDCHSMQPVGPPIAKDAELRRPLICLSNLGNDVGAGSRTKRTSLPKKVLLELSRILARVFAEDFAFFNHPKPILFNNPYRGGYITQRYSSLGYWVLQIEISKALYIHPEWFDSETRTADENRLQELNAKLGTSLAELARYIDKA